MMKPKLQFSTLCDNATRGDEGKINILGIFETIGATRFPMQQTKFSIVNCWCGAKGSFSEQVRIIQNNTNETIKQSKTTTVALQGGAHTHTTVNQFTNTLFEEPGEYAIEVLLDNENSLTYPLTVNLIQTKALKA
jgi:hypothetical protein